MTEAPGRWPRVLLLVSLLASGCGEDPVGPDPAPEPKEAGYELRVLGGTSHTAALREVLELEIVIDRPDGGYDGPVSFTAEAPPGIVVVFRPSTVLISNSTDVLVVADDSVEPRHHQVAIRGTAPDRPDRVLVLDVTVTP